MSTDGRLHFSSGYQLKPNRRVHTWKRTDFLLNLDGKPLCDCGEERSFLRTDTKTGHYVYGAIEVL